MLHRMLGSASSLTPLPFVPAAYNFVVAVGRIAALGFGRNCRSVEVGLGVVDCLALG